MSVCHDNLFEISKYFWWNTDPEPNGPHKGIAYLPTRLFHWDEEYKSFIQRNAYTEIIQTQFIPKMMADFLSVREHFRITRVPPTICPITLPQADINAVATKVNTAITALFTRLQAMPHIWNVTPGQEQGKIRNLLLRTTYDQEMQFWWNGKMFFDQYGYVGENASDDAYVTPAYGQADAYSGKVGNVCPMGTGVRALFQDAADTAMAAMYNYWNISNTCCNEYVGSGDPPPPPGNTPGDGDGPPEDWT